jgi:cobalt-zinc-cadmium efflux system membrane fusion protein
MQVKLRASAWPDEVFRATLVTISDFIDPATRTVKVRGTVDNRERKLKGEMFVSAEIDSAPRARLQVPEKAVVQSDGKNYVFVETAPGQYARVEIELDGVHRGAAGIVSGVSEGQKVVVEGNLFLHRLYLQLSGSAAA